MQLASESISAVLTHGLSAIRPLSSAIPDEHGWNFAPVRMPSCRAYGRIRALYSLLEAERIKPRRVFEVAAGDASLCASLRERTGCDVVANDLREDDLCASVSNYLNGTEITLMPGNIFDISPDSMQPFDLVIACEVIEHVAHGTEFLTHLSRFLSADGCLLLTTPNGRHFRNKLPGYYEVDHCSLEAHQFKPDADGHLYLIRPEELHAMAAECGFTC